MITSVNKEPKTKDFILKKTFFKPVIQKKLSVGSANDSYEVEADQVADKVMKMPEPSPKATHTGALIQRKCAACEEEDTLRMKPLVGSISPLIQRSSSESNGIAPTHIENQINSSKGGGSLMDSETKTFMESRFGTDFSNVKIHTGSKAVQMNRELNAQAFAIGNDIYFNEGKYNPNSDNGKHLLAHELTHTVQQVGRIGRKIQKQDDSSTSYYIRDITNESFRTSILARIEDLEVYLESESISEVSRAAIHLLRQLYEDERIQVWETIPTEAAAAFSRHGSDRIIKIHSICSPSGEDCRPPLISSTILLHEAIHALHQTQHPEVDRLYRLFGSGHLRGRSLINYLRYRVWTEYFARVEVILYNNQQFPRSLNIEDHRAIMRDPEMRRLTQELREALPEDEQDNPIDPRRWDSSEFN